MLCFDALPLLADPNDKAGAVSASERVPPTACRIQKFGRQSELCALIFRIRIGIAWMVTGPTRLNS